jgi:hypothetical protein
MPALVILSRIAGLKGARDPVLITQHGRRSDWRKHRPNTPKPLSEVQCAPFEFGSRNRFFLMEPQILL